MLRLVVRGLVRDSCGSESFDIRRAPVALALSSQRGRGGMMRRRGVASVLLDKGERLKGETREERRAVEVLELNGCSSRTMTSVEPHK